MKRRMKPIYATQPPSVRYKGYIYVLAAEGEEGAEGEELPLPEEEEAPPSKKMSTGAARVRIDECTGESITFNIKALVHSYDGDGVPGLADADGSVRKRNFKVRQITKINSIPSDVLSMIEADENGEAVMQRIEKMLRVKPSPPLYFLTATGGWNWHKRNGDKDVAAIQELLEFLRGRKSLLFSYCHNKVNYGDSPSLI
jgi:hypothetical protein